MYVAVKGGETAILNSYKLLDEQRRGDPSLPELTVDQIRQQLKLSVDRVMTEGSVYDPELAALAIKQASGDLIEAIFLLRAYRATLPRFGNTCAIDRATRLQNIARGDEGFLLAMAYSTQRGYSHSHPFVGEVRLGEVAIEIEPEELGFAISIGDIEITECEMVNQFAGSKTEPPKFTRGYGLAFGHSERKAMAMSLVDRALRAEELGEDIESPAQMQEFVLSHSDSLEASGFVQHLKLPHYVDFQSELELVRKMRANQSGADTGDSLDNKSQDSS